MSCTSAGCKTFTRRLLSKDASQTLSIPLAVPSSLVYDYATNTIQQPHTSNSTPLVNTHDCGPFRLVPEALQMLSGIAKPVAVLSICGPYRSGKSYILSRILGIQDAFGIGHTMKQCTQGIWLATTALECDDFVVVFLDTEGTDSASTNQADLNSLLVMTVMMSSTLIYNSKEVPRRSDLEAMR